jgi:hypothetical protein
MVVPETLHLVLVAPEVTVAAQAGPYSSQEVQEETGQLQTAVEVVEVVPQGLLEMGQLVAPTMVIHLGTVVLRVQVEEQVVMADLVIHLTREAIYHKVAMHPVEELEESVMEEQIVPQATGQMERQAWLS